ncbi:GNAT family N-acetyltransferase [Winogradskyella sp. UBA3174]|uniref:GNAT family N-acetyltransferase n=1 Tax=Winogradskyella sp. UBA3174 TaxID=1947785 RepID=UPI0025E2CBF2|nr:GNAT family N-acetyltransferase [Winogradskyella sp. UBA3174]|tara:strand:+ start:35367 stop:36035 length:669 start_codon:yes stop_codon:yes gene_type:complete
MKNIVLRLFDLIKKGELKFLINGILKRIISKNESFGLKRDLNVVFQNPDALIDITIRPFRDGDQDYFTMDLQNDGLVEKKIPTCFVATNTEDIPCYRQWLLGPKQNNKIQEFWGKAFPVLNKDEALIESVFAIPTFRGNRIMPAAMARIAEKGKDLGIRWVIVFVGTDNIPSLKGCQRSGFYPYVLRTDKWFMFKKTIAFTDISKELMDTYSNNILSTKPKN